MGAVYTRTLPPRASENSPDRDTGTVKSSDPPCKPKIKLDDNNAFLTPTGNRQRKRALSPYTKGVARDGIVLISSAAPQTQSVKKAEGAELVHHTASEMDHLLCCTEFFRTKSR